MSGRAAVGHGEFQQGCGGGGNGIGASGGERRMGGGADEGLRQEDRDRRESSSNSLFEPGSRARVTDMDQIKAVVSLRFALVKASFKSYLWQAVFSLGMLWYLFSMTKGESENLTSTVAFMWSNPCVIGEDVMPPYFSESL